MTLLRLAHLSDPHLTVALDDVEPREWLGKRAMSRLSWARGRKHLQKPEVLAAAIADIHAHAPDHLAITGDVTNFSLPVEFRAAAAWFATLGAPADVSVIPGNHDALVPVSHIDGWAHWQPQMQGDAEGGSLLPYVRVRNGVALLGLSSAVPTAPGFASGTLGPAQLQWLAAQLQQLGTQDLFRIVMLHHPPADGVVPARKVLTDRAGLRAVLAAHGAELVLHGHSRDARFDPLPGPRGLIASFGLPSISAIPNPRDEGARWHLLEIAKAENGWRLTVTVRVLDDTQQGFATAARYTLQISK
ncbi:MAG: metallophosphoesterase [Stagnimonas sp.]|nr:metallophosphoesterase [Stagnimonas sp.]